MAGCSRPCAVATASRLRLSVEARACGGRSFPERAPAPEPGQGLSRSQPPWGECGGWDLEGGRFFLLCRRASDPIGSSAGMIRASRGLAGPGRSAQTMSSICDGKSRSRRHSDCCGFVPWGPGETALGRVGSCRGSEAHSDRRPAPHGEPPFAPAESFATPPGLQIRLPWIERAEGYNPYPSSPRAETLRLIRAVRRAVGRRGSAPSLTAGWWTCYRGHYVGDIAKILFNVN